MDVDIHTLIKQCVPPNVPAAIMVAIADVESGHRAHLIGYKVIAPNGKVFQLSVQPKNPREASGWAQWLLKNGYEFDAGIAQVHSTNFPKYGLTAETAFHPCENIRVGALILAECYGRASRKYNDQQYALRAAFSCYQSGNFSTGFNTGYVNKVIQSANKKRP